MVAPTKEEFYDESTPSESNNHWFPWLSKQLILRDIHAVAPEMPKAYAPVYSVWAKEFERFDIGPETMLVGHSCGGGFLVRWLSENKDKIVGKVVLVAPWINPENNPVSDTDDFFDFEMDPDLVSRTAGVTIFNSIDDSEDVQTSVKKIRSEVKGIKYKEFQGYGHFCYEDLKSEKFPELLSEIIS
jgi:predicted alpha/beta hydrolase family esterase